MEMKRCVNGHFYDPSKYQECPYCQGEHANESMTAVQGQDIGKTMPLPKQEYNAGMYQDDEVTQILRPKKQKKSAELLADEGTEQEEYGGSVDPVVGWLVCIAGAEKGKDYRIHAENNYIGRGDTMDIQIHNDATISRDHHAVISYDPRTRIFYFSPGPGRNIVRLNDEGIFMTQKIKARDIIEIGETKLMFLPFCGEEFNWEAE